MNSTFHGIADGPVIALATLRLKRTRLSLPCKTRQQAIGILRGLKAAPPRRKRPDYFINRATSPMENLNETA